MLKKILLGLAVIIVVFLIVVALQPSNFRVTRSATMAAPPAVVFAQVNNFHNWRAWSPWEQIDPEMKRSYEGPSAGTGAKYSWVGNSDVGEGSMTITESRPSDLIRIELEFIKPMEGTSDTEFTFEPKGDGTEVTWDMAGKNSFLGKAFCLFMNMDKMIGDQFEEGLANMESVVEAEATQ
ncbi:MAG: SRPBCC family protein [Pirellulales bacterium]